MPDYNMQVQGPNLGGLDQGTSPVNRGSSRAATAELIGTIGKLGAQMYGSSKAKEAGTKLGGTESYEAAGIAAEQAAQELEGLRADKYSYQGSDVTPDQAKDLRDQVFGRVLTNQKRIQSAVDRGLISSAEATARLSVLRNEALSNPLVAPYQDQLDNALYKTTGGSGTTFAATAAEQQAAAAKKGELAAIEESQKQVSGLIHLGMANNEKQALSIIAQAAQQKRTIEFLDMKRTTLNLSSQEVYAANQVFQANQAQEAIGAISAWQKSGGDSNQKQNLQAKLVNDGEITKQNIRSRAFDKDGNVLVNQEALAAQLAEVDKRTKEFVGMLDDQSGTKKLLDTVAQLNASMELKGAQVNTELSMQLPYVYALKDQPVLQQHFLNALTGTDLLKTNWISSSNPVMKAIAQMPNSEIHNKIGKASEGFNTGGKLDAEGNAIQASTLLMKGGGAVADSAYKNNPEGTITNLRNIPFLIKDIVGNREWEAKGATPEGRDQLAAVVESAAERVVISSMYDPDRRGSYQDQTSSRRYKITPKLEIPETVKVVKNKAPEIVGGGRGQGNVVGKKFEEWSIDTGGVLVTNSYKSELVNAYKLGEAQPGVWNEDFDSMDAWLNHLFTRPSGAVNATKQ